MSVTDQCPTCSRYRGLLACDAFPDGIPQEILSGLVDHADPYPGDQGLRYQELDPDAPPEPTA